MVNAIQELKQGKRRQWGKQHFRREGFSEEVTFVPGPEWNEEEPCSSYLGILQWSRTAWSMKCLFPVDSKIRRIPQNVNQLHHGTLFCPANIFLSYCKTFLMKKAVCQFALWLIISGFLSSCTLSNPARQREQRTKAWGKKIISVLGKVDRLSRHS